MLLPTLQSKPRPCQNSSQKLQPFQGFWNYKSLSWWSESLSPPSGEKQFWEFHVTSFGACSGADPQNMWVKACILNTQPQLLFGRGPSGCEWRLADGKQAISLINLPFLWLMELSDCFKEKGGWRETRTGLVGEVHDQQHVDLADNKQLGDLGIGTSKQS